MHNFAIHQEKYGEYIEYCKKIEGEIGELLRDRINK
jgi:hypothetical protein